MKSDVLYFLSAALIGVMWLSSPCGTQAGSRRVNISISGNADNCADLKVRSGGEIARSEETFTLPGTSPLELNADNRGSIRVRGSDRADFSIQACKIAAAESRSEADTYLKSITVNRSGSRVTSGGPSDGEWMVYFIVHAPRKADLDIEARNGPVSIADVSGRIRTRAANGPVSISDVGGDVQVRANNGPVSFSGSGGNVSLTAQNGPVSIKLSGAEWNGQQMEARTINGPVSLNLPETYRSAVQVNTGGHAPFSCRGEICSQAFTTNQGSQKSIQLNGSNPVVRVSTENGPVSVNAGRSIAGRII